MARGNHRVQEGLEIRESNGTGGMRLLRGAGAPPGTSGKSDDAEIGSLWFREDGEGEVYHKIASTSSATDWEPLADSSVYTALGLTFDDEDFGTFTGSTLSDNASAKTLLQELETAIEANSGTSSSDNIAAATPTTVNTCLADDCNAIEYEVFVFEQADETKREAFKIFIMHDGETGSDATKTDETVYGALAFGGDKIAGLTFTSVLSGVGAAQTVGLQISATAAITVKTRRTALPAS